MKKLSVRVIALLLTLIICGLAVACVNENETSGSTDSSGYTGDTTSGVETPSTDTSNNGETDDDNKTNEEENDPKAHLAIDVKWNLGYVASSKHPVVPNQLVDGGANYSYTDVFTVEKAGTTITFTDDNKYSNGDAQFAVSFAYVVSSWEQNNGKWALIEDGFNYEGGNVLSRIIVSIENDAVTYEYTTTNDNENLRLCYRSGQTSSFTPKKFPTVYAEYTGKAGTSTMEDPNFKSILKGITISAVGDSYFDGVATKIGQENIWVNLLAEKYEMKNKIDGVGGATVADARKSRVPVCERAKNVLADSDIVLLEGGRNDYNLPIADSSLPAEYTQVPIGEKGSKDITTFIGAWNVIIDGVQEKCPNAMIVLISPWNFPNSASRPINREVYINAMKEVAEEQGVYFIDASNTELIGVDMQSYAFRAKYSIKDTDVSHLNADGMKFVLPKFEKILAEYYTEFLSK